MRSKVTRRSKARRSAVGAGGIPFASNFAKMKASIGFLTHAVFLVCGGTVRLTGRNDQKSFLFMGAFGLVVSSQSAPRLIQRVSMSIS